MRSGVVSMPGLSLHAVGFVCQLPPTTPKAAPGPGPSVQACVGFVYLPHIAFCRRISLSVLRNSRQLYCATVVRCFVSRSTMAAGQSQQDVPLACTSSTASTSYQPPAHAEKAWAWFRSIGAPKLHVAPMVDQSELPFRLLCRRYGATCAYTPMLHARIFSQDKKYRDEQFTYTPEDRPLLVQFCANDPNHLLAAARVVEASGAADAVDINFGCPQRIARRGNYGAFLMDDLKTVEALVRTLATNLSIPVTCKIRVFPDLQRTIAYARMIEAAGCSLLAVHGRTREQKDNTATRADWDPIRAVKQALTIPVLANGNLRHLADVEVCMAYTGCDGVLSAEGLLANPALFCAAPPPPISMAPEGVPTPSPLALIALAIEYVRLVAAHPVPMRMVRGHVHRMVGGWLAEHIDLRGAVNVARVSPELYLQVLHELQRRALASGRDHPLPTQSAAELAALERELAKQAAMEEQEREAEALGRVEAQCGGCSGGEDEEEAVAFSLDWSGEGMAASAAGGSSNESGAQRKSPELPPSAQPADADDGHVQEQEGVAAAAVEAAGAGAAAAPGVALAETSSGGGVPGG